MMLQVFQTKMELPNAQYIKPNTRYSRYDRPMWKLSLLAMWLTCAHAETWTFNRLDKIGGHAATASGHPRVVEEGGIKAVEFNGVDDALLVDNHPLAGATVFTWEVIFKPYSAGNAEQRFFHMQVGEGSQNRLLFETRIIDGRWCLDSFSQTDTGSKALIDRAKLHSLDSWHHVAMVYDGKEFRHYVDGQLQGSAMVKLGPQGSGQTSVGVRINKVDYFKGAIRVARMTRRALAVNEFLKVGE